MNILFEELRAGLPGGEELARVSIRLVCAALFGGVIGFERQRAGKAAGLRTHMLVALGAAVFVVAGMQVRMNSDGLSRVIQGLVTGIGFLGGGAILKSTETGNVEGLTTAAGIWLTAGIGVAVGLGLLGVGLISVVVAWTILAILGRLEARISMRGRNDRESPQ